jgi:ribonuclease HI|nr:MAG TPA: ribonuclease HI [Caudoviricetes sp.]
MTQYTLITDGAYSSARDQGGIGLVFLKNGEKILEYSKMYKSVTNNMMELGAVIIGLRLIKNPIDSLTIVTDSMYVIGCATKGWKRKKNVKLWQEFDTQYERVKTLCPDIRFEHVKGHDGDKWNEYCDKLAVKASQSI